MQFNSYLFIFVFLSLVVLLYHLANRINLLLGKLVIIVASIFFYAYERAEMLIYLGISIAINYLFSLMIARIRRKQDEIKESNRGQILVALPVVINVALLIYFKYWNFGIDNLNHIFGTAFAIRSIVLPLGISFYTFQQIAYVVSLYRGELKDTNLIDYLAYILYFPKILMGPLMEPSDFISQLNDKDRKIFSTDNLAYGIQIFSLGLFKKVLIADTFASCVTWGYQNFDSISSLDVALMMLFYTFEIYFDFSGYTDMAVGVSKMIGIDLPMNFDSPYKAISIRDFWKRWHMSLTKFFTKYIYIPLGGSRKGELFTYINTMIVFTISGFWHGANWTFVLWGIMHGLFMVIDRILEKKKISIFKPVRWFLTFVVVNVLWLLFSAESIGQWWTMLVKIVSFDDLSVSKSMVALLWGPECNIIRNVCHLGGFSDGKLKAANAIIVTILTMFICIAPENNHRQIKRLSFASMALAAIAFVWGVICLGGESSFVYFGF